MEIVAGVQLSGLKDQGNRSEVVNIGNLFFFLKYLLPGNVCFLIIFFVNRIQLI
jgi:hypothetical protein